MHRPVLVEPMPQIELSVALTVNPRTEPILRGEVAPEGITFIASPLFPSEIFWRQLKFGDFDVSEMSLASLLIATSHGPTDWVALPVFTSRRFYHTEVLVRADAGIREPRDLRGRRVGVPEYQQTAAVWARGVLQHAFGVEPQSIDWYMERTVERSHGGATGFTPPPSVRLTYLRPETDIATALLAGELDATLRYYNKPNMVDRALANLDGRAEIAPLFADPATEGRRYYAETGVYPINHCVVVRRTMLERHRWIALNVYKAFVAAKDRVAAHGDAFLAPYREVGAIDPTTARELAIDPMPYGIRSSRLVLETIARYLTEQGLTARTVALDEIFAQSTLDL